MNELVLPHGILVAALHAPGDFSWTRGAIHWDTVVGSLLWVGIYLWGIGPARRRYGLGPPVARWRVASFLAGTTLLLFSLNGPLHDLSDYYLFSAHMVQHLILVLFVPPLWLLGTPGWLWRPLLQRRFVWPVARFFTLPLVTFIVYKVRKTNTSEQY
jgi:putative membrane protein